VKKKKKRRENRQCADLLPEEVAAVPHDVGTFERTAVKMKLKTKMNSNGRKLETKSCAELYGAGAQGRHGFSLRWF